MIRYKASNLWTRSSDKDLSTGKPVDRNRINLNIVLHGKDDADQCPVAGAEFPDGVVVNIILWTFICTTLTLKPIPLDPSQNCGKASPDS